MADKVNYVDASECVIISDILYYISNKLGSTPVKNIVSTCNKFYTDDEYVFNEKKKLCVATAEPCKERRSDTKRVANLEDICAIFVRRDSQSLFLPKFASIDLNNIPVTEDGNPSLGQILAAISDLKKNAVTTDMLTSSMKSLREELSPSSQTSTLSLPPEVRVTPGVPSINEIESNEIQSAINASLRDKSVPLLNEIVSGSPPSAGSSSTIGSGGGTGTGGVSGGGTGVGGTGGGGGGNRGGRHHRGGGGAGGGGRGASPRPNQIIKRGSRESSRPRTIIGKNVNNGLISIKGADLTMNKFISRFHNDTTNEALRDFIIDKGVSVVELEEINTTHNRYKSFRLRVKRTDLVRIDDAEFWPQGVILCPYFRPRNPEKRLGVIAAAAALPSTNNGE